MAKEPLKVFGVIGRIGTRHCEPDIGCNKLAASVIDLWMRKEKETLLGLFCHFKAVQNVENQCLCMWKTDIWWCVATLRGYAAQTINGSAVKEASNRWEAFWCHRVMAFVTLSSPRSLFLSLSRSPAAEVVFFSPLSRSKETRQVLLLLPRVLYFIMWLASIHTSTSARTQKRESIRQWVELDGRRSIKKLAGKLKNRNFYKRFFCKMPILKKTSEKLFLWLKKLFDLKFFLCKK